MLALVPPAKTKNGLANRMADLAFLEFAVLHGRQK